MSGYIERLPPPSEEHMRSMNRLRELREHIHKSFGIKWKPCASPACHEWLPADVARDVCHRCRDKIIDRAIKGIV